MSKKIVKISNVVVGSDKIILIAGPCAVESKEQYLSSVKNLERVDVLRGGAFKPRTSPSSFLGLREDGLEILKEAKEKFKKPIVTELTSEVLMNEFDGIDAIQVGARNMQNFELLKALGKTNKTVVLKRGFGATINELIEASKYVSNEGNDNIILVERGIRTFEDSTRFTLDISAIPVLKEKTPYPILVDPSHASGNKNYIEALSLAAVAAGADGLMIEVHSNPKEALSDNNQALTPKEYNELVEKIEKVAKAVNRSV